MKRLHDHRGMSLVEIIIVLAVIGIMMGVSVSLIGHVGYANTRKIVEAIDGQLEKQRVETMSQKDIPYLYIYQLSDGYYMRQLTEELNTFDPAKMTSDGEKLCGNNAEIYMESTSGTKVSGASGAFIRIAYKRSGVFDVTAASGQPRTNVTNIVVTGRGTYTIHLVADTGKHYVE